MNRIISESVWLECLNSFSKGGPTYNELANAPLATTLDLTMVRRFNFSDVIPGVIYPDPNGPACWFADLATIHNAGQVGWDDDGEPIHQVGWLDPKDPTRIQVTTHYMIRELGNPENWVPLYAPNDGTTQIPTVPQPVHGVPSEQRCKCPRCGSEEIDAMTARTVYDCGSSDYDARPGTFRQSDKCTLLTGRQEGRS